MPGRIPGEVGGKAGEEDDRSQIVGVGGQFKKK